MIQIKVKCAQAKKWKNGLNAAGQLTSVPHWWDATTSEHSLCVRISVVHVGDLNSVQKKACYR